MSYIQIKEKRGVIKLFWEGYVASGYDRPVISLLLEQRLNFEETA